MSIRDDSRGGVPSRRVRREKQTVGVMIGMWCRSAHGSREALCTDCSRLLAYAESRIDSCRFGSAKPACNRCTVHCYAAARRAEIRAVMRFAGPRMLVSHPVHALLHAWRAMFR